MQRLRICATVASRHSFLRFVHRLFLEGVGVFVATIAVPRFLPQIQAAVPHGELLGQGRFGQVHQAQRL